MPRKIKYAQVFVENTNIGFDKAFDYLVPFDLEESVFVGQRVMVPFGRANRKRQAVIVSLSLTSESDAKVIKPITLLIDKKPLVTTEMLKLAYFIKEFTFCSFFEALKPQLASGIHYNIVYKYEFDPKAKSKDLSLLSGTKFEIVKTLKESKVQVTKDRLCELYSLAENATILDELEEAGYIIKVENAIRRINDATIKMLRISSDFDIENGSITATQRKAFDFLLDCEVASAKEISYFTGVSQTTLTNMVKKGILESFENEIYRSHYDNEVKADPKEIVLTNEQSVALEGIETLIDNNEGSSALLFGVTGSGKTQVFLKAIDKVVQTGKGVIVMVPEIALTPQTMNIFRCRYGGKIAIMHSAMSVGQRTDEWKRIKNGDAQIAIGTRSAVFAPFKDIGLIIMDEEQEHTYKSESTPRFHARDVAKFRSRYHKCLFLMASATPSVETFSLAKNGKIPLFELKNRYGNVHLPQVKTVDMLSQYKAGNFSPLSDTLCEELENVLQNKQQAIILLNRRGYNILVTCRSCGDVKECPNCSISLTYHSKNNRLMCHYCGYSREFSTKCSVCDEEQIKLSGFGTQKIQDEIQSLFKDAKILRMDADTTMTRFAHEEKFNAFANKEYDIMIGTQMVAKGLDFPNVTLVGVVNADHSLFGNDYRAYEKTFSLLTQVIGRSGRGEDEGIAVIQTIAPDNEIISLSAAQDFEKFYETEIMARKIMIYPPFCDIVVIGFTGFVRDKVKENADDFFFKLKEQLGTYYSDLKMIILGPSICEVPKVNNKYRYRIIVKCKNTKRLRELFNLLLSSQKLKYGVSIFADLNPENIF